MREVNLDQPIGKKVTDGVEATHLVSIIINNYNYQEFVLQAVESAITQTYRKIEVIVVDDGSSDDSVVLLKSKWGDSIELICQENKGQAAALNAGFAVAKGDIVFFLDADDVLYPCAVEIVVGMWSDKISKCGFRLGCIDAENKNTNRSVPRPTLDTGNVLRQLLKSGHYVTPPMSGNAFSRSALKSVMPIPEEPWRKAADAFLLHAVPFVGPVVGIELTLGSYRIHDRNQSANSLKNKEIAITKLRRYVATELRVREVIREAARGQKLLVDKGAVVNSLAFLKACLALSKLTSESEKSEYGSPWENARRLCAQCLQSGSAGISTRTMLMTWAFAILVSPSFLALDVVRFAMSPGSRPKWTTKIITALSR